MNPSSQSRFKSRLAIASALLLGTACGEPVSSGKPPAGASAPPPTAQVSQPLGSVKICGQRHEIKGSPLICFNTTDVGAVYTEVVNRISCTILTPTSWESCMEWPPVLWPELTSAENSALWAEQAQRIVNFYKAPGSTKDVTMKSNQLTLEKIRVVAGQMLEKHGAQVDELSKRNQNILSTELSASLKQRAAADNKAVQAESAERREKLTAIQAIIDAHQARLVLLQPTYDALLLSFASYRSNEDVVLARLQTLAQRASTATLQTLPNVQLELVQLSRAESLSPQQMALDAKVLAVKMGYEHGTFSSELAPYAAFMGDNDLKRPNLVDTSIQMLENIGTYADARYARTSDIVKKTLEGISRRQEALSAQSLDAATRKTLTDAATLEASQKFLAQMNARVSEVGKLPPRSSKLSLYFLAEKLREHESILQLQPVCANISSTPWMGTGCNALSPQYSKSRTYATSTIPSMIRLNLTKLRTAGVNPLLLQQVEQYLTAQNIRAATVSYDVAVRASESL